MPSVPVLEETMNNCSLFAHLLFLVISGTSTLLEASINSPFIPWVILLQLKEYPRRTWSLLLRNPLHFCCTLSELTELVSHKTQIVEISTVPLPCLPSLSFLLPPTASVAFWPLLSTEMTFLKIYFSIKVLFWRSNDRIRIHLLCLFRIFSSSAYLTNSVLWICFAVLVHSHSILGIFLPLFFFNYHEKNLHSDERMLNLHSGLIFTALIVFLSAASFPFSSLTFPAHLWLCEEHRAAVFAPQQFCWLYKSGRSGS